MAKTRALIAKLHALVMQKYEAYRNRRLPIAVPPVGRRSRHRRRNPDAVANDRQGPLRRAAGA